MALDKKITELTDYTTPQSGDLLPVVDILNGITKKILLKNIGGKIRISSYFGLTTTNTEIQAAIDDLPT